MKVDESILVRSSEQAKLVKSVRSLLLVCWMSPAFCWSRWIGKLKFVGKASLAPFAKSELPTWDLRLDLLLSLHYLLRTIRTIQQSHMQGLTDESTS